MQSFDGLEKRKGLTVALGAVEIAVFAVYMDVCVPHACMLLEEKVKRAH